MLANKHDAIMFVELDRNVDPHVQQVYKRKVPRRDSRIQCVYIYSGDNLVLSTGRYDRGTRRNMDL